MTTLLKALLLAATFALFPVLVSGQTKITINNQNFETLIQDKGWSYYDSASNIKDIVVVKIGKDSTMIGYMNFLEGLYSVTYKTDIKIADNSFRITVNEQGSAPYLLATGSLESSGLMIFTFSQNPVPGINSMFDKGLTLRLEEVKEEKKED